MPRSLCVRILSPDRLTSLFNQSFTSFPSHSTIATLPPLRSTTLSRRHLRPPRTVHKYCHSAGFILRAFSFQGLQRQQDTAAIGYQAWIPTATVCQRNYPLWCRLRSSSIHFLDPSTAQLVTTFITLSVKLISSPAERLIVDSSLETIKTSLRSIVT